MPSPPSDPGAAACLHTLQALAERLNVHCNPSKLSFERGGLGVNKVEARWASERSVLRAQGTLPAIGEALKTNSTLTSINVPTKYIGVEGAKARGSDLL